MVMNKLGCVCIRDAWCFRVGTKKMWHDSKCFLQKALYVHVCMRKLGRTTRYAKLPEGTAPSSMIFLMVYRLRSSQKNAGAARWKWKLLGQVKWLSVAGLVPARRQSALQGWSNVTYERPTAQDIFNGQPIKVLIRALGCFILAARQKAPTSPVKKTTFFAAGRRKVQERNIETARRLVLLSCRTRSVRHPAHCRRSRAWPCCGKFGGARSNFCIAFGTIDPTSPHLQLWEQWPEHMVERLRAQLCIARIRSLGCPREQQSKLKCYGVLGQWGWGLSRRKTIQ